jgi:hypothetical protein
VRQNGPWFRINDDFYEHPKFEKAGPLGIALWAATVGYCRRKGTDGVITMSALKRLLTWEGIAWGDYVADADGGRWVWHPVDVADVVDHLVEAGLFVRLESERSPSGRPAEPVRIHVHDYTLYQQTAAEIEAFKAADRERKAKARATARAKKAQVKKRATRPSGIRKES